MLLDAFTEAWSHEESRCEKLHVKCRKVDHDIAIFLVTCNDKVVSQFPINLQILNSLSFSNHTYHLFQFQSKGRV